jgi:hypothetical protein
MQLPSYSKNERGNLSRGGVHLTQHCEILLSGRGVLDLIL